jgi:hypothetical protein
VIAKELNWRWALFTVFYLAVIASIIILYFVREKITAFIFCKKLPTKESYLSLISIGILPAVIIMDFGLINGLENIGQFLWVFISVHIITEIIGYKLLKNEKKNN